MKKGVRLSLLFSKVGVIARRFLLPLALLVATISFAQTQDDGLERGDGLSIPAMLPDPSLPKRALSSTAMESHVTYPPTERLAVPGDVCTQEAGTLSSTATSICKGGSVTITHTTKPTTGTLVYLVYNGSGPTATIVNLYLTEAEVQTALASLNPGTYCIYAVVYDGNNCRDVPATFQELAACFTGQCYDLSEPLCISVLQDPVISMSLVQSTICVNGTATLLYSISGDGLAGCTYDLTATGPGGSLILINDGAVPTTGTLRQSISFITASQFTFTITVNCPTGGCNIDPVQAVVNVVAAPSVAMGPDNAVLCLGGSQSFTANVTGGAGCTQVQYLIKRSTDATFTAIKTVNSGTALNLPADLPSGYVLTPGNYSVRAEAVCTEGVFCSGVDVSTLTVRPNPDATPTPSTQTINSGATITPIVMSGTVSGTTFAWTRDNTASVTGIAGSGSGDITGALTNTTTSPITVTFTITPTANNCEGVPTSATVTVGPSCTIQCPANIEVNNDPGLCGAVVSFEATITGQCGSVSYSHAPGSLFPIGTTTVNVSSTAGPGCSFTVKVNDNQPPVINTITNPVVILWSPNHSYQTISMSQLVSSVTDNCGNIAVSNVKITKVTSDEPENAPGTGDGNTTQDIRIAANCKSVQLRRERIGGGNGRVYTIHLAVKDSKGNPATATAKVIVPPNQSGVTAVDNGPAYTVTSSCNSIPNSAIPGASSLSTVDGSSPRGILLRQNYPNPFSGYTTIRYSLPAPAKVYLTVYNSQGQVIAKLVDGQQDAGTHDVRFDASKLATGIYLYRLQTVDGNGQPVIINRRMVISR